MRKDSLILIGVAIIVVAVGVFVFLSGNSDLQNISSAVANNSASAVEIPFKEIMRGSQSTIDRRVNYIITSSDQFSELWKIVNADGTPPEVDFNKDAVIAVFAGQRPATGYSIAVAKVEDAGSRMVSITLANPDESCILAQSITTPYQLIAVPATSLTLSHKDIITTTSCSNY